MKLAHLGGLTAKQFFRDYWQKKPLLIRQAFPGFSGLLTPDELAGLACEEDVQSRLVMFRHGKWQMESGPFDETRFAKLPKQDWALLVQAVNHFVPEAAALLQKFNFVPTARLDDLMVSFAPDGGGVGPHFDSYDVFLLQGQGKRLWRISDQQQRDLVKDAPLRILKHFETQQEWLLEAGDMLYLPPQYAHWGIAVGDCMTYSIGFRAPSAQELATQFLVHLQDNITLDGFYADPDLVPQSHPAEISAQMLAKVQRILKNVAWDKTELSRFLGIYLTEPKPHVVFTPPKSTSREKFSIRLHRRGIKLALQSQMLFGGDSAYLNGMALQPQTDILVALQKLADNRVLQLEKYGDNLVELLYQWYRAGFLEF